MTVCDIAAERRRRRPSTYSAARPDPRTRFAAGDRIVLPTGYLARIVAIAGNRLECRLCDSGARTIAFPREVSRIGAAAASRPPTAPATEDPA